LKAETALAVFGFVVMAYVIYAVYLYFEAQSSMDSGLTGLFNSV